MKNSTIAGTTIKRSQGEKVFTVFNYIFFTVLSIIMLYPFWHVIMMSFSSVEATAKGGVFLWPQGFNLDTYSKVFKDPSIWSGYFTTIMVTIAGTGLGTLFTATTAYPLSKKDLPLGKTMNLLILFTMLFSGGMIPGYLLIKNMYLIDNRWSLVLPGLISAYNVIIMRSFFSTIPESLEESARLDGANDVTIFAKIILPLSKASIATIALFTAVGYWNDYFTIYMYAPEKATIAYGIQRIYAESGVNLPKVLASMMFSILPVLVVFACFQKLIMNNTSVGGLKG